MRGKLFLRAIGARDLIASILAGGRGEAGPCKSDVKWGRIRGGEAWPSHAAIDGGQKVFEMEGYSVYAVRSYGILSGEEVREHEEASVGLIIPPQGDSDRVSMYREILEAYTGSTLVPESGAVLMDGAAWFVIWWWPKDLGPGSYLGKLEEAVSALRRASGRGVIDLPSDEPLATLAGEEDPPEGWHRPYVPRILAEMYRAGELGEAPWVTALELTEKLLVYKRLMETAWFQGSDVVFIAKTSKSTRLCGGPLSDTHILRILHPRDPGYTVEGFVSVGAAEIAGVPQESAIRAYPEDLGLREFYVERLGVADFYVRLSPFKSILHVSLAFDSYRRTPMPGEIPPLVSSRLSELPLAEGYPATLSLAHERARISSEDAEVVARILRLGAEPGARRVLYLEGARRSLYRG